MAMRGEFRFTKAMASRASTRLQLNAYPAESLQIPEALGRWLSDGSKHADAMAIALAEGCLPEAGELMDAGRTPNLAYPRIGWDDWAFRPLDAFNQMRTEQAFPGFTLASYATRWIDHVESMTRVARTLDQAEALSRQL